jgi:lysophospholipase L1-like esterase
MAERGFTKGPTTRREFIGKAAATTAAALSASSLLSSAGCSSSMAHRSGKRGRGLIASGNVILFQGDSITDAGRDRNRENNANDARALGSGYAFLTGAALLADYSEAKLTIYNRGISGNKVFQLADRWDKDCIALKPDVVSILIGVNDLWHKLDGKYNGTIEIYERDYRALLERTRRELPAVKLVICEPFVLRCGAVNEKWFPEFDSYRAAARRVAIAFDAVFVPFQTMFDEAVRTAPPAYWAGDGVHPTIAGAALMAQTGLGDVSATRT